MTEIITQNLTVRLGDRDVVHEATLRIGPNEFVALIGPNGAGKTSLLRAMLGLGPTCMGAATLAGLDVKTLSPQIRARHVAYLPQARPLAWPNVVRDIVALGRFAHGAGMGRLSEADAAAVERALSSCGLSQLANRRADTLSGGELARVHCARAFAAEAPLLLADEPAASLDLRHQHHIFGLIRRFTDAGGGALVVVHDVGLVARYADRVVWMHKGDIVADGPPGETITSERLGMVFGVEAEVRATPQGDLAIDITGPVDRVLNH